MALTPQPSGEEGSWTLKQIAHDIPLTVSAREVVELGQRLATMRGAPRTDPEHLLEAMVLLPKNAGHRALTALNTNIDALRQSPKLDATVRAAPAPVASAPSSPSRSAPPSSAAWASGLASPPG